MNLPISADPSAAATPEKLEAHIFHELYQAAGARMSSWQQRTLAGALRRPVRSAAHLFSDFDATVGREGLAAGFARLLAGFVKDPRVAGAEDLPAQGPLIIASNHPGAYDLLLIGSALGRRDLRIVSSTVPFFRALPNFHRHLVEVGTTAEERRQVIPESARHVQSGGALLIFPSGLVDPDPDVLPGAHEALATWRPGIAALVNRAPDALVTETIASGVLSRRWINNPLLRVQKTDWQRRKLAEMFQVIQQIVWPKTQKLSPRLTFGPATCGEALQRQAGGETILPLLVERAQAVLSQHMTGRNALTGGEAARAFPLASTCKPSALFPEA
jgi:hypothetical protein